ncbi:2-hydroxymuconate tautomerase [Tumebacillus permanentifrigoris]|uniref:Tautomerase n=1 Tax=Tumebacillus permanentifrigoris TaxID=378543 RepID=A0A316DD82_9BACL|nr:2-hydroxymuconate tautomerase [Tumebacillus permanentifrigoris]PWK15925.1 4-oxalocrotonate tautomerase [Tumebacillus permanentifrigoris]
MPFVHIEWMEGRTLEQKRELTTRITAAVAEIAGIPNDRVHVFIRDMKKDEYAVGGELLIDKK